MSKPSFTDLLRSIEPGMPISKLKAAVEEVQQDEGSTGEKSPKEATEKVQYRPVNDPIELQSQIDDLKIQLEVAEERIAFLEFLSDQAVPNLVDLFRTSVVDENSARMAIATYNVEWFQMSPFSVNGKAQIAKAIFEAVKDFTLSDTEALQAIAKGSPDIMARVQSTPENYDDPYAGDDED